MSKNVSRILCSVFYTRSVLLQVAEGLSKQGFELRALVPEGSSYAGAGEVMKLEPYNQAPQPTPF